METPECSWKADKPNYSFLPTGRKIMKMEMEMPKVTKEELLNAIHQGVEDAMGQMITNATDCPCEDFFDSVRKGVSDGIRNIKTTSGSVDTSALSGFEKHRTKAMDIDLEPFVQGCIAEHDPCTRQAIRYESAHQFNLSEHKSDEMLNLAIARKLVAGIQVKSTMKYVVNRPGFVGKKALLVAAILTHNPKANARDWADPIGVSKQYINRIKARSSGNWVGTSSPKSGNQFPDGDHETGPKKADNSHIKIPQVTINTKHD
jgi:hypothetical protein